MLKLSCHSLVLMASLFMGLLSNSCAPQGFSGSGGTTGAEAKPKPKPDVKPDVKPDPGPLPVVPSCTEAILESVTSMTTYVDQDVSGSLELALNFRPCPTQAGAVALPVLFDVDANLELPTDSSLRMTYEILVSGVRTGPGYVDFISGKDLFGKSGGEYGYFRSNGNLTISPSVSSATLKLKLTGVKVLGPSSTNQEALAPFFAPIYVKVGQSAPVKASIKFSSVVDYALNGSR